MNRTVIPVDLGRLVGLVGPGAWALYAAYATTYITLASLTLPTTPDGAPVLPMLLIFLAAGAVVASPSATLLPRWRLWAVWLAVAVTTTLGTSVLVVGEIPAIEAWFMGANSFLLFATALRARIVGAWIGMAIMVAVVVAWSVVTTATPWQGLAIVHGQPVALLAGTFFSLGLHTTARRIAEYHAGEARAAAAEAHEAEAMRHRTAEMEALRTATVPTLRAIAQGELGAPDRRRVEILEATLRDRIRGRVLAEEPLVSAVLDLRRRGADVLLLDDLGNGTIPEVDAAAMREWAAARLAQLDTDEATVRITREAGVHVVTITTEEEDLRIER